jgi:hypothetical protein
LLIFHTGSISHSIKYGVILSSKVLDTLLPDNGGVSAAAYWLSLSGQSSQDHSISALVSDFHLPPTL